MYMSSIQKNILRPSNLEDANINVNHLPFKCFLEFTMFFQHDFEWLTSSEWLYSTNYVSEPICSSTLLKMYSL